jgi:hypothetical protein
MHCALRIAAERSDAQGTVHFGVCDESLLEMGNRQRMNRCENRCWKWGIVKGSQRKNRCWKWGIVKGGKSKFFDSATSFWHFGFHPMYSKGGWVLALPCTPLQGLLDYKVTHL